ncbi:filamentous hemagglutinin N-terminal domain-containing protein [Pantoea coffeiphila]|uniref:Filamentous haemagglutinin FhaB/tRNA nuclease CdiA-like TPS domain-containing protein n=1 Tax=Pantoea coffeiphila TaxID=1465635 RepID=A0A2S9I6H2_9GAMM|nr:filamentous hemagglutinin N-terminal domain-containing protein [Pantoea coffeiphila]PRD13393.1 hypothetical protein CQW29_21400 [Pantoea coffeiphila]
MMKNKKIHLKAKTTPLYLAIGMICLQAIPAHAAVISDLNQGNIPTIKANSNGSITVNINSASNGGISHNKFTQFDVTQSGVVLNNSAKTSATTVAGNVSGNKNMANGSASLIINEVTQNRASQLKGLVEVAGEKANVIISNPAGITCDGCGFVNTKSATLTTGKPIVENSNLTGVNVSNGTITVTGRGMNDKADFTTLLARTVKINADLKASDLQINTGVNENVPFENGKLVNTGTSGVNTMLPEVGVDVSRLGGMYANKITLISGGQDVGVNNKGLISANTELHINSNGAISNSGTIKTNSGNMQLIAKDINNNAGSISSSTGDITLLAENSINNEKGRIVNQGLLLTNSINLNNNSGLFYGNEVSIVADNIQNKYSDNYQAHDDDNEFMGQGGIQGKSDVNLNANSTLNSLNSIIISETGTISLASNDRLSLDNSVLYAVEKDVILNADMFGLDSNNLGLTETLIKGKDIIINVKKAGTFTKNTKIDADNDIVFNKSARYYPGYITNNGTMNAANEISINNMHFIENYGVISAGKSIDFNADLLDNHNVINSAGNINLSMSEQIFNYKNASILSGQKTTLRAPQIANIGNIIAYGGLNIASNEYYNKGYTYGKVTETPYD